jgi:ABC-type amino acid transport substrate-binding protein
MENADLEFEAAAFPTAAGAMKALENGEIDCVFPANLSYYDSEELGVVTTPALMRTEMDAVVRAAEQKEFIRKRDVVVAVNEGNTNYDMFLADHYPGWKRAYFPDTPTGLDAVAAGQADCVIISNYRFSDIARQCSRLNLTTVYTGVEMDYCLAVKEGSTILYSILSRLIRQIPESTVNAALNYYSAAP